MKKMNNGRVVSGLDEMIVENELQRMRVCRLREVDFSLGFP